MRSVSLSSSASRFIPALTALVLMFLTPIVRADIHGVGTGGGLAGAALYEPREPTEAELEDGIMHVGGEENYPGSCSFAKFDPDLGTLTKVEITVFVSVDAAWDREGGIFEFVASGTVSNSALGINLVASDATPAPVDNIDTSGALSHDNSDEYEYTGGQLSQFIGEGTIPLEMDLDLGFGGQVPAADPEGPSAGIDGDMSVIVEVEYFYTPAP